MNLNTNIYVLTIEADVTGKETGTGMGRADSDQASPGLRQDEAGGSIADSECVTGLAGLTIGTECGKNVEDKTFGTFGNNLDLTEKNKIIKMCTFRQ